MSHISSPKIETSTENRKTKSNQIENQPFKSSLFINSHHLIQPIKTRLGRMKQPLKLSMEYIPRVGKPNTMYTILTSDRSTITFMALASQNESDSFLIKYTLGFTVLP